MTRVKYCINHSLNKKKNQVIFIRSGASYVCTKAYEPKTNKVFIVYVSLYYMFLLGL